MSDPTEHLVALAYLVVGGTVMLAMFAAGLTVGIRNTWKRRRRAQEAERRGFDVEPRH